MSCTSSAARGGLPQVLVELQILQDEVEPARRIRWRRPGFEPDGLVLHPRHPRRVLGLGLGQEVGLEATDLGVAAAAAAAS